LLGRYVIRQHTPLEAFHVRILLLAASAAALLLVAGCAQGGSAGANEFDRQFIDMMVPHHQGAVEMARIAQQRGGHPEIKEMARAIIADQEREIGQMKAWRQAWFGSDQTPPMDKMPMVPGMAGEHGGHGGGGSTMNMAADVEALRQAPEPFDRAFIDAMILHHESAIAAAEAAETRAQKAEIKDLAKAIIAAQQREIDRMTEWRLIWYGGPAGRAKPLR
jgi:uncharacterized protein (DUF305 family)